MITFIAFITSWITWIVLLSVIFIIGLLMICHVGCKKSKKAYNIILENYKVTIGKSIPDKTLVMAHEYFNIENWCASRKINYRLIKATTNSLVGLGILGTFVGLAFSLGEIDLSGREEEITSSIQSIVGGMNTAFWSSVFGMGFSLVYGLIYRVWMNKLDRNFTIWCKDLDDQYYIDQIHLIAEQTEAVKAFGASIGMNVGNQVASQLENSMTELIETITDCVKDEMKSAGQYMAESATQLKSSADSLRGASESIIGLTDGIKSVMRELDETLNSIVNMNNTIKESQIEFQQTVSELGDSATQFDATIKTLDQKFGKMVDILTTVQNSVTTLGNIVSQANSHNDNLDKQYKSVQSLIEQLSREVDKQSKAFYQSLSSLEETIGEVPNLKPDIEAIFKSINEGLKSYVDLLQNQTSGLLSIYTKEFTKACQSVQSTTGQLTSVMEEGTSNLTEAVNNSAHAIGEAAKQLKEATK